MRRFGYSYRRRPTSPLELVVCLALAAIAIILKNVDDPVPVLVGIGFLVLIVIVIYFICKGIATINATTSRQSSHGGVSSGYRMTNEMIEASKAFYRFLSALSRSPRCCEELDKTPGLSEVDVAPFTIHPRLAFIVFCDVRDVFKRLGHDIYSLHNSEGVGYAVLVSLIVSKDIKASYFNDSTMVNKYLSIIENLARDDIGNINIEGHENELRFAVIFGLLHHEQDWVNRYATLLYRWASLIAKANGVITQTESDVLKSIMDLRVENGAADISGNVRVSGGNAPRHKSVGKQKQEDKFAYQKIGIDDGLKSLNELIGLEPVKREVRKLASFIDIQRKREKSGLQAAPVSYHCVFTGNPGTGKTTVARILAEIYREMGVVKKGHLVETDRSGLIGEYVGQTAVKTNKIIDTALDGVLFIDEAYSLIQGGEKDYGREAIATLLKRMEDDRKRLVVILAGYTNEMKVFIDSNPGLQSRFNRYIEFPDYNAEELAKIFLKKTEECQYTCNKDVRASIVDIMERAVETKDKNFGNGRFVRNLFENAIQRQAVRLSTQSPLTAEMLAELTLHDLGFAYEN